MVSDELKFIFHIKIEQPTMMFVACVAAKGLGEGGEQKDGLQFPDFPAWSLRRNTIYRLHYD
jgi:hypothetical protein